MCLCRLEDQGLRRIRALKLEDQRLLGVPLAFYVQQGRGGLPPSAHCCGDLTLELPKESALRLPRSGVCLGVFCADFILSIECLSLGP